MWLAYLLIENSLKVLSMFILLFFTFYSLLCPTSNRSWSYLHWNCFQVHQTCMSLLLNLIVNFHSFFFYLWATSDIANHFPPLKQFSHFPFRAHTLSWLSSCHCSGYPVLVLPHLSDLWTLEWQRGVSKPLLLFIYLFYLGKELETIILTHIHSYTKEVCSSKNR